MLSILRLRVSGCFASSIQRMKSLRAIGVRLFHFAIETVSSVLRRSSGVFGSVFSLAGARFVLFMFVLRLIEVWCLYILAYFGHYAL